jgi:cell division protein FtsL
MKTSNKLLLGLLIAIIITITVLTVTFKKAILNTDNSYKGKTELIDNE